MKLWKDATPSLQPPAPPAGAPTGPQPPAPKPNTPAPPPISNLGPANGAPRDFNAITNPNDLTKADIERMQQTLGFDAANKKITEMAMAYHRDRKLRPDADPNGTR
jgi:hypothetical protein